MRCARRLLLIRLALLGFVAALVVISLIANRGEGHRYWGFLESVPCGDKLGHFGLVGTLALLLNLALAGRKAPGRLAFMLLGSLLVFTAMSVEEMSQCLLPARTCDWFDWLANAAGIAAADFVSKRLHPSHRLK